MAEGGGNCLSIPSPDSTRRRRVLGGLPHDPFNSFTGFHGSVVFIVSRVFSPVFQFLHRIPLDAAKELQLDSVTFQFLHRIPLIAHSHSSHQK